MFLLANWKSIIAVLATAVLAYGLHALDVYRLKDQQRAALYEQSTVLMNSCKADKAITEGVSHDYEAKISSLNDQLAALGRVRPSSSVVVQPSLAARRHDAAASTAKPSGQDAGITSDALFGFARDAEAFRLQLMACQAFITETWKVKGQ